MDSQYAPRASPRALIYIRRPIELRVRVPSAMLRNLLSALRFSAARRRAARANIDTAQWTPELLRRLEWRRFEELCAAYFEAAGSSPSILVQCRPWDAYGVGIKPVRGLHEAMAAANIAEGVLVTSGKFTQEARAFAAKEKITLVDGDDLLARINALVPEKALALLELSTRGDFLTPTCPACGIKMVKRKSTAHGRPYWGCRNYPGCKNTLFVV
jgi:restriction system protein